MWRVAERCDLFVADTSPIGLLKCVKLWVVLLNAIVLYNCSCFILFSHYFICNAYDRGLFHTFIHLCYLITTNFNQSKKFPER